MGKITGGSQTGRLTKGFATACIAGALFLFALGLLRPNAHWAVVVLGPLLIMWLYYIWGRAQDRLRIHQDVLGDSLYYMGFLFTLVSLAASLLGLLMAPDSSIAPGHLLGRFGVALTTTIFGFFTRTLLGQLTPRLDQEEREVQAQIHRHVVELSEQLTLSVFTLNEARLATETAMTDSVKTLGDGLEKALTQAGERIAATLEENMSAIVGGYQRSGTEMTASAASSAETIRVAMNEVTDRIGSAVGDLEGRIRAFEPPQHHVQAKLDDLFAGLSLNITSLQKQVAETSGALAEATEGFKEFAASASKSTSQFSRTTKGLTALAETTEAGSASLAKGAGAFATLEQSATAAATGVTDFADRVTAMGTDLAERQTQAIEQRVAETEAWANHLQALAVETATARTALRERLEQDVAAWREAMTSTLEELDTSTRQAAEQRTELSQRGADEVTAWKAHAEDLHQTFEAARTALRQTVESSTQAYAQGIADVLEKETAAVGKTMSAEVVRMVSDFAVIMKNLDGQLADVIREHKAWQEHKTKHLAGAE